MTNWEAQNKGKWNILLADFFFLDSEMILVVSFYSPRYIQYGGYPSVHASGVKISQYVQTQSQAFTVHT